MVLSKLTKTDQVSLWLWHTMQILKPFAPPGAVSWFGARRHSSPQQSDKCLHQLWALALSQACVILRDCPVIAYFHVRSIIVMYFII